MILYVLIWAVGLNWLAYARGYYRFPRPSMKNTPHIKTSQLATCFAIYLAIALLLTPLLAKFLLVTIHRANPAITSLPVALLTFLQLLSMIVIFLLMQLTIFKQDAQLYRRIWKDREYGSTMPIEFDFGLGAITWLLAFPIVVILGEVLETILKRVFGFESFEQTAVKFVKLAADSPFPLIFALISVLIMAPFIEEFLFRGILQTHLKKRVGSHAAILFTALLFALFHFSPSQGLGNISLIFSLFLLGGYLGFLYEKQGSLWAPIGLHMTFNTISAVRILFFPESA